MKKIVVTFGGESLIKEYDLYGYRRGVREKVCYHLRWGKPFRNLGLYGYRRGGTFDSPKVPKSDLGLRPKNPTHRNARPEGLRPPGAWAKRCL